MTPKLKTSMKTFLKDLQDFANELCCVDRVWNVIFPDRKGNWSHLHVTRYRKTFYVCHIHDAQTGCGNLEVEQGKAPRVMDVLGGFLSWSASSDEQVMGY